MHTSKDVQIKINAQVAQLVSNASTGYDKSVIEILEMVMRAVLVGVHCDGQRAMMEQVSSERES